MKFSYSWLKDHLDTQAAPMTIAEVLSSIGFEVENVEDFSAHLQDITVAHVQTVENHPDSDHLHVCAVDDGSGKMLQIVCGAANVRAGMNTALVHCGGIVPKFGEALKPAKIRGVESQGMLCSLDELGIESDADGIIDVPLSARVGEPIADALGLDDQIFTISVTPNRGDCFSVRGIARELAAAGLGKLKPLHYAQHFDPMPLKQISLESLPQAPLPITVTTGQCAFFFCAVMEAVHNKESPAWIQKRLRVAGQKSIDALVDVTNFLNFDIGQPMHVYDLAHIDRAVCVRQAQEGETLELLNSETRELSSADMVVADESKALTLAGVMGGAQSGSALSTSKILLEAAYFDPVAVTKTGQKHMLRSESRTRFERGIDPGQTANSMSMALALIQAICGGKIVGCTLAKHDNVDVPGWNCPLESVTLNEKRLQEVSGDATCTIVEAEKILNALGFETDFHNAQTLKVLVPSWRHDVALDVDLIEEVLRIKGYDKLPMAHLPIMSQAEQGDHVAALKNLFCARGLNEVYTLPFVSEEGRALFAKGIDSIEVLSPLNKNMQFLRNTLLASLLNVVALNQSRCCKYGGIFEIESIFLRDGNEAKERKSAAGIRFGTTAKHWLEKSRDVDVFDAKADLLAALDLFQITSGKVSTEKLPGYYHPNRAGALVRGKEVLGYFGEIHPMLLQALEIDGPVVAFELSLADNVLAKWGKERITPYALSFLQPVQRDFAFVVGAEVEAQAVLEAVQRSSDLITYAQIFDVFQSPQLGENKKSIAIQISVQPKDKTLSDDDLQQLCQKVIDNVAHKCGAELRSM